MKKQLEKQFRQEWSKYIRPLFIESRCSKCGSKEKLHVHHEIQFSDTFKKGWKLFDMDNDINQDKINIFSSWLLGEQLKSNMITLCEECHLSEHDKKYRQEEKQINIKFREKVTVAFLCKTIHTDNFLLSYTDMMVLNGHTTLTRTERQRINYITQGNKKYSYDEYVKMFNEVNFDLLNDIDTLLTIYNNHPKEFAYILEIYYYLQLHGEMNLTKLIKCVDYTKSTFYNKDLELILKQYDIFKVYDYVDKDNNTHKMFSLIKQEE